MEISPSVMNPQLLIGMFPAQFSLLQQFLLPLVGIFNDFYHYNIS